MSLFFVDSNCDLDRDYIKKLGVECIDLSYSINDKVLPFNSDFDYKKFYSKCKKGVVINNVTFSTDEYIDIFEKCFNLGDDIIYVHSSSNIVNNENLELAKEILLEKYPDRKFELIDSQNLSIGQGLISNALAMMYRRGDSLEDIVEKSYEIRQEYTMYFAVGSTEQMKNKGLIDSSAVSGSLLNVKPVFTVDLDGKISLVDKVSGKKKAIIKLLEVCRQYGTNVIDYPIDVVYSNDELSAIELVEKLKEYFGNDAKIHLSKMSPSNAAILGDSVLGIAFHVYKKIS